VTPFDELVQELTALRADIQALPDRIVTAASKEIKRELMEAWWTLVALALLYGLFSGRWIPVIWGGAGILLYVLSNRLFRSRQK
jgi:hypothetical protein